MVFIRRTGGTGEGCDIVLCEECAKSRGINARKGSLDLNIDDLIGTGLDLMKPRTKPAACPVCGLELSDLMREGRLGCAACADAFPEEIARAQGRKLPIAASDDLSFQAIASINTVAASIDASGLDAQLESALASEDYERAARLRDELSRRAGALSAAAFPDGFPGVGQQISQHLSQLVHIGADNRPG